MLALKNDRCGERLCLMADQHFRMARKPETLVRDFGKPACFISDNGTAFTNRVSLKGAADRGVDWHYFDPGKPQQSA